MYMSTGMRKYWAYVHIKNFDYFLDFEISYVCACT